MISLLLQNHGFFFWKHLFSSIASLALLLLIAQARRLSQKDLKSVVGGEGQYFLGLALCSAVVQFAYYFIYPFAFLPYL